MPIDNTNRYFKGQQKNEELVYTTRKHWVSLLNTILKTGLFLTALVLYLSLFIASGSFRELGFINVFVIAALTIWLHSIWLDLLNYFLDIVVITNFRMISVEKSIFIRNDSMVVDLHEIQDVRKIQHGIIPNLLNYGKLIIVAPTMIDPMVLTAIPNPDKFFRKINNAKRDYIYQRQQQRLKMLPKDENIKYMILNNETAGSQ